MNNIVNEIRKKQDEILLMVNSAFDEIVRDVSGLTQDNVDTDNEYEVTYPITNTTGFKSKKVIAVILNGQRIIAPTWKNVFKIILTDAITDQEKKRKLYSLCDRLLGRKRTRLSSSSNNMRSPLKLADDLYVETHYDTETLMNLLLQILNEISYDYSAIKIVIKN